MNLDTQLPAFHPAIYDNFQKTRASGTCTKNGPYKEGVINGEI